MTVHDKQMTVNFVTCISFENGLLHIYCQAIIYIKNDFSAMASCHGNTFHITGPLWGESIIYTNEDLARWCVNASPDHSASILNLVKVMMA